MIFVYFIFFLFYSPSFQKETLLNDEEIKEEKVLILSESPYRIVKDLIVSGTLTIEPGVEIQFAPKVGLTIRGVLIANGTPSQKIKFTSLSPLTPPLNRTIRLVDGPNIHEGVVQLLDLNRWRYVCTNSRNWTTSDMKVACGQLGFSGGEWTHWFSHLNNTHQILYQEPGCIGIETKIEKCFWNRRQIGSGVCDLHPNLGLRCLPFYSSESKHWRGLRFESALFKKYLTEENTLYVSESKSVLRHVEIIGAGQGYFKGRPNATSAIETWGVPPIMDHILIQYSAYNGINITSPKSVVFLNHLNVTQNRGIGIYINSTSGHVVVQDSSITSNMADGIKYVCHDQRPESKIIEGVDIHDFCTYSTTYSQTYPFTMIVETFEQSPVERVCGKRFYTKHGFLLTLHFLHISVFSPLRKEEASLLEIRDGSDENSRLIRVIDLRNYTRPESVVSTGNNMFILFKGQAFVKTEVFLEITTGKEKDFDLQVFQSVISRNSGSGIWIEALRSALYIQRSIVEEANHGAGIKVHGGAGSLNVTHSYIRHNFGDGINVTYGGGVTNVSWSTLSNNNGYGFALHINESSVNEPVEQEVVVAYSNISLNRDIGVLVGNYCGPSLVNISGNAFVNNYYFSLEVSSCWIKKTPNNDSMNLIIGHNHFLYNEKLAVKLSPLAHSHGVIEHNDFKYNQDGCLVISNDDDYHLEIAHAQILIHQNRFLFNFGSFVLKLGLSHHAFKDTQSLEVKYNWIQNNVIREPWTELMPRSRVAAPIVLSSSNVRLFRNLIQNPNSSYELGSHYIKPNGKINCKNNWLGDKNEKKVWLRIFDRDDRYNLAQIEYIPYLLSNNMHTELSLERPEWENSFLDEDSMEIGGEVTGVEELREDGVYIVKRDIFVRPQGRLKITPGVTLKFDPGIGMMIAGEIIAEGDFKNGPLFTLNENEIENQNNSAEYVVRLLGGKTNREGFLQVYMNNEWGYICTQGWTIDSASLACQQMGLILNPDDWEFFAQEKPDLTSSIMHLTNVRCDRKYESDVRFCKLCETEFFNSCSQVVGLKCYGKSWAGLRLGMTAKRSKFLDVTIEKAGLLDYQTNQFSPAIQVDFSHHVFEHINIRNNDHDGLRILYSDLYYPDHVNIVKHSKFTHNKRHGLSFQQFGLVLEESLVHGNGESGIHHDPKIDKLEQRELMEWMSLIDERKESSIILTLPSTEESSILLQENESRLLISEKKIGKKTYHVRCERDEFVIGIQLLNPFHNYSTEKLIIYDYRVVKQDDLIKTWNVSQDLLSFPLISSSYAITLLFDSGNVPLGNMMMLLTPIPCVNLPGNCNPEAYYIHPLDRSKILPGSFPRLTISKSIISENRRGISALHYNKYFGDDSQLYLRKANESIEIFNSEISSNREDAFFVFTPFRELNHFNISEITIMINQTIFRDNGRGINQYSKDLRDSNNIYHWVLRENIFENNIGGGLTVSLPYVWQYNENITHTVHVDSNIFRKNRNFDITINGHFARIYIVNNTLVNNLCSKGLISLKGMEKECWIFGNIMEYNEGIYMMEFDMDSHTDLLSTVPAYFTQNLIQNNGHSSSSYIHGRHVASSTLSVKGIQKFNITDNLFGNKNLDFELLSGIQTARLSNILHAERNYWGTANIHEIRRRIFDFDDWNSFALTHFSPYYLKNSFESDLSSTFEQDISIDLENLGGRIYDSIFLKARPGKPYVVKADITIMPKVTLTIEPGVELEFFPNVGILVLGTLHAQGNVHQRISFRPVNKKTLRSIDTPLIYDSGQYIQEKYKRKTRSLHYYPLTKYEDFDVRLCQAQNNGTICPPNSRQGFLEIFNRTTEQWIPVCDSRFSERNAQVVCRQLGFEDINVFLDFGIRNEYTATSLNRIIYWPEPFQCSGRESKLPDCPLRLNGQIYGHNYGCNWEGASFAFLSCGESNLNFENAEYWGGIRFSVKEFEEEMFHDRIHDAVNHNSVRRHESILEYVEVIGAGLLHGEKAPAIQAIMVSPLLSSLNISQCAHDGINLISPSKTMNMLYNKIENNLGVGISAAVLSGEVRQADVSAFTPLERISIPYRNFGLVDICDSQKEIVIEERMLLYYKYDNNPVDCVKIFSSTYDVKPIGFRLLQYNFVNSSGEPWTPDHLQLFDGDLFNKSAKIIVTIKIDGSQSHGKLYQSTRNNGLSIKFHGTGGREHMGFVAEVSTLPISSVGMDRDIKHNISFSVFSKNQRGSVFYSSAGEISPILTLQRNQFIHNCVSLYGNFSTCDSAVNLDIQNTQDVFFFNNFLSHNIGGVRLFAGSSGTATALRALFHNNVFENNRKKTILHLCGRQTSPYQQITMFKNYFTRNSVAYESVLTFFQVVVNATGNTIVANEGKSIIEVMGFANVRLPIYQSFTHNGFYNNHAFGDYCSPNFFGRCRTGIRATIVAGSAGQEYVDNIFYNIDNDYELVTLSRSEWDVWKTPINAKYNYWAYNETLAVAGRIRDLHDEAGLLEVDFTPFQMNNRSLLSGIKCHPGWTLIGQTCFMYFGGPMSYSQAEEFCLQDNSSMPYITDNFKYYSLTLFLETQQSDWRYYDMVWVKHLDSGTGDCTVFVDGSVRSVSCDFLLPTLCENDPHPEPLSQLTDILSGEVTYVLIAVLSGVLLIALMSILWCSKSRQKKKERFERRNSIRMSKNSLAGSRSLVSFGSGGFHESNYRRHHILNASKDIAYGNTSIPLDSSISVSSCASSSSSNKATYDTVIERPDDDTPSYDVYDPHAFGSHLSPSTTFSDTHDVHYISSGGGGAAAGAADNKGFLSDQRSSLWSSDVKKESLSLENESFSLDKSSKASPYYNTYDSFRPQPSPPPPPSHLPPMEHNQFIFSVPGYAKPFAHNEKDVSRSRSAELLLETNLDEPVSKTLRSNYSVSVGDSGLANNCSSLLLETDM